MRKRYGKSLTIVYDQVFESHIVSEARTLLILNDREQIHYGEIDII